MEIPTLDELAIQLQAVSGADAVDPDTPLQSISDVDSLDLMEWLYGFQNKYPHIPADESLFKNIDETTTLRSVYEKILAIAPQATATA
jgi:hypothetical protein